MPTKYTPEQRIIAFWNKVNKDGSIPAHCPELGRCWEWIAGCTRYGYGQFSGKRAHRYSWELANGKIPNGLWVLHKCDNPKCVNPDHLFLGTNQDNVDDMMSKERMNRGEKHYRAKLTDKEVLEIRKRYAEGGITHQQLSFEYNVWVSVISTIIQRRTWKHI